MQTTKVYNSIISLINTEKFKIPVSQNSTDYYPDFLNSTLSNLKDYYENILNKEIEPIDNHISKNLEKAIKISEMINKTVDLYYQGKLHEAYSSFAQGLDNISYNELTTKLNQGKADLYRGRIDQQLHFNKRDLFHIPFEHRKRVSTQRYSIPGLPALYLGGSVYTCWEELHRPPIRQVWFSRFSINETVRLVQIQRIEDFYKQMETVPKLTDGDKLHFLNVFLLTFPLSIACSIKVKDVTGNFKPEYIIPQFLLQYISKSQKFDGIIYPSTIIDYQKIYDINTYNYVFPVKEVSKTGFCTHLIDRFYTTSPTSLEMEELIYNVRYPQAYVYAEDPSTDYIEIVDGVKSSYVNTAFGRLEMALKKMRADKIS